MSKTKEVTEVALPTKEFAELPLDLIDDPARPMRSDLSRENIDDLVKSIKQIGLIEPIIVKRNGDRYEVIAGHRRTVASEYAGLAVVPCHIATVTNDQAEMMKIHENLYRVDITPADEAKHYSYLIDKQKLTPADVARLISRSKSYVLDRLDILNYHPDLSAALDAGQISFSVAKEFNRMTDEAKLIQYIHYAVRGGMTAGQAKKWVDDLMKPQDTSNQYAPPVYDDSSDQAPHVETSKCFFCSQALNVLEAQVVYVHGDCITERQKLEVESPGGQTDDPQAQ